MAKKIKIYDTTLRYGELLPGFILTDREKIEIAKQSERLGVSTVDVGDIEDAAVVAGAVETVEVMMTVDADERSIDDAAAALKKAKHSRINIRIPNDRINAVNTESLLIRAKNSFNKLQITVDVSCVLNSELAERLYEISDECDVDTVCIADTTGYALGHEVAEAVFSLRTNIDGDTEVAVSCQNDLGMAVANSLSAVGHGAEAVECSLNGVGKRAGNAPLEEIVVAISARGDQYGAETDIATKLLFRSARLVSTVTGFTVPANKPVIGDNAMNTDMYEQGTDRKLINPEDVGIFRGNLVLGRHSTQKAFEDRVFELGFLLNKQTAQEAYSRFVRLAERKKLVTDRDIEALVSPLCTETGDMYELVNFVINTGSMIPSTATIIMKSSAGETVKVATGTGPVDASFKAIDKVFGITVKLEDFSLQSVSEGEDALGDASVKIRCGDRLFTGKGVSADIVEASIKAYIHALNKAAATLSE